MPRSLLLPTITLLLAHSVILNASQITAPCLDRPPAERPYSRVHLIDIVRSQTPLRAEYLIRTCGVKVPINAELESDLREAGAEDNVIAAVRDVAPKPPAEKKPEPVREPLPAPAGPAGGEITTNSKDGLRYVYIPPGTFRMGCSPGDDACGPDEKPAHEVRISKGYWMGQTDVTAEAYKRYVSASGGSMPKPPNTNWNWSADSVPMTMVSWNDAHDYCAWAAMRLPTEAEWEYAARAGTTGKRYADVDSIAWYSGNPGGGPHAAAGKQPNAFKLYDMLGNVWQWTADWYKASYESSAFETDPQGPRGGGYRVSRGGSWQFTAASFRASVRFWDRETLRSNDHGFRCAGEIRVP